MYIVIAGGGIVGRKITENFVKKNMMLLSLKKKLKYVRRFQQNTEQ